MNITFRWYGRDNDTVTLEQIKQIPGTKGIVWAFIKNLQEMCGKKKKLKKKSIILIIRFPYRCCRKC